MGVRWINNKYMCIHRRKTSKIWETCCKLFSWFYNFPSKGSCSCRRLFISVFSLFLANVKLLNKQKNKTIFHLFLVCFIRRTLCYSGWQCHIIHNILSSVLERWVWKVNVGVEMNVMVCKIVVYLMLKFHKHQTKCWEWSQTVVNSVMSGWNSQDDNTGMRIKLPPNSLQRGRSSE